jgi:quercetin dioxygenase-like cupin family protein
MMMVAIFEPRIVLGFVCLAAILGLSVTSRGQAPQAVSAADEASRFTGKSAALDATGYRATRRRFEAGARSAWHSHTKGQLLFVEEGHGRVQQRGQRVKTLAPGESDYTGPNVPHWHGAVPDQPLVQAALAFGGETTWMEKVTDDEYAGKKK